MMNEKYMFKILKRLLDKKEISFISEHIVIPTENDTYQMYGTHKITKVNGEYIVTKNHTHTIEKFNNLRNAIIWVTLEKSNNIVSAKKIVELDTQYTGNLVQIEQQKRLLKSKNIDLQSLAMAKMQEQIYKNTKIIRELDYYAGISKNWQNKRFAQLIKS
jgi:hypothetical protein